VLCRRAILASSGNAIRGFWVFTRPLAAALERHQDLRLTRLACGKLERVLPARLRENGATVARAAGQLPAQNAGRVPTGLLTCTAPPGTARQGRCAVRRALALPAGHRDGVARSASAVPGGAGVAKLEAVRRPAHPAVAAEAR